MNFAIYARVSTAQQAEHGYSLQTQVDACTKKAMELGATSVKNYIDDKKYNNKKWTAEAWIVDIEIGDASQLRTAAAESFDKKTMMPAEAIADRVHAVVAFNADYYISRLEDGFHIRQGTFSRDKLKKRWDVLLIDEDGDFHPVHLPDRNTLSDTVDGKKVINAFCFGPILVEDGELVVDQMKDFTFLKPDNYYSRLAICQVGPLHYKVILTTMEPGAKAESLCAAMQG